MKGDTLVNGTIGVGGTFLAWISSERAAIFAGVATGLWMLWQLGTGMWDRWRARRSRR